MDADLRKRKLRKKVPMTFVTSEPYIGHLGLGGVGDSRGMLESELRDHDIKWITNAKVTRVEEGKMFVEECNEAGEKIRDLLLDPEIRGTDLINRGDTRRKTGIGAIEATRGT